MGLHRYRLYNPADPPYLDLIVPFFPHLSPSLSPQPRAHRSHDQEHTLERCEAAAAFARELGEISPHQARALHRVLLRVCELTGAIVHIRVLTLPRCPAWRIPLYGVWYVG